MIDYTSLAPTFPWWCCVYVRLMAESCCGGICPLTCLNGAHKIHPMQKMMVIRATFKNKFWLQLTSRKNSFYLFLQFIWRDKMIWNEEKKMCQKIVSILNNSMFNQNLFKSTVNTLSNMVYQSKKFCFARLVI